MEPGPLSWARRAVEIATDKQASHILLLDLRPLSAFTDFFVLATAESSRQMHTIAEEVERGLEALGASLHHREGTPDSGWVLLDYGDLVIHLFGPEERAYYRLEEVWRQARPLIQVE